MAAYISELLQEELFLEWKKTETFIDFISKYGREGFMDLWMRSKIYSSRIAEGFPLYDPESWGMKDYEPTVDFIRICEQIDNDDEHDQYWKITMRAVLFTMICTFCYRFLFYCEKEMHTGETEKVKQEAAQYFLKAIQTYHISEECMNPEYNKYDTDQQVYDDMLVVLEISKRINLEEKDLLNPYIDFDTKDYIVENHVSQKEGQEVQIPLEDEVTNHEIMKNAALKAAIEDVMKKINQNRHWFSILKVLVIHEFAVDLKSAANLVASIIGKEVLDGFNYKINVDDLNRLDVGTFRHEVSRWEKDDGTFKTKRIDTYKRIAIIFENNLLKAGLIEQEK